MICTSVTCFFFWYKPSSKIMGCPIIQITSNTTLVTGSEDIGGIVVFKPTEQECLAYIAENSIINPFNE